jgi:predicted HD phosphohydrolase
MFTTETLQTQLRVVPKAERARLIVDYIKQHGSKHYEEDVTQYQHAVQTAYLATQMKVSNELIAAALMHDIGHMLADDPMETNNPTILNDNHEAFAATYLRDFFPPSVYQPIYLHVEAKRYLCTIDSSYYDGLSRASQKSFHLQGGKMSETEKANFENNTYYKEATLLRQWDDKAKDVDGVVPEIEFYEPILESVFTAYDL